MYDEQLKTAISYQKSFLRNGICSTDLYHEITDVRWYFAKVFELKDSEMIADIGKRQYGNDSRTEIEQHSEGTLAKVIEQQTAKVSSDIFLWAAAASILGALALKFRGRRHDALFVGQWAAPFLLLGVYNKLVKVAGSDRTDQK